MSIWQGYLQKRSGTEVRVACATMNSPPSDMKQPLPMVHEAGDLLSVRSGDDAAGKGSRRATAKNHNLVLSTAKPRWPHAKRCCIDPIHDLRSPRIGQLQ